MLFASCNASRVVVPLEKNESMVGFSFGGALIDYGGTTIPIPFTSFSYARGIDTNLTLYGGIHTTALYYKNIQVDFGVTYDLLEQNNYLPAISVSPALNTIIHIDGSNFGLWPQLDLFGYWQLDDKKLNPYLGLSNWFEPKINRAHKEKSIAHWVASPVIGCQYNRDRINIGVELKLLAPGFSNEYSFVPYKSIIPGKGATGVFLNISKKFGK